MNYTTSFNTHQYRFLQDGGYVPPPLLLHVTLTLAETTLVPFASLPSCVAQCGVLYDVNGACVPPAVATADAGTYDACFCKDARLAVYSTATAGPCDAACATEPAALGSIQGWYTSFCANQGAVQTQTTSGTSSTGTSSPGSSTVAGSGGTW